MTGNERLLSVWSLYVPSTSLGVNLEQVLCDRRAVERLTFLDREV
jgi:hypothetical protein